MGLRALCVTMMLVGLLAGCKKQTAGVDLSTPRAAASTFTNALEKGDAATATLASSAGGIETDLVAAMAESASGIKKLNAAAIAKFGDDGKRLVAVQTNVAKNLSDGEVEITGDRALLRSRDGRDTMQLKRDDAGWKVDIGALIKGQDVSHVVPIFRAAGLASRKTAEEIESGKLKTVDEAKTQMAAQMTDLIRDQMQKQFAPTTAPAAAP